MSKPDSSAEELEAWRVAQVWLVRAEYKLTAAKSPPSTGIALEDYCCLAHQAAEVAIKAVYIHHGWTFPYIHDLERLLQIVESEGLSVESSLDEVPLLHGFAVQLRYPNETLTTTAEEYAEVIRVAERVIDWARRATAMNQKH